MFSLTRVFGKLAPLGILTGCLLLLTVCAEASESSSSATWINLFNGEDLAGWHPKIRYRPYGENYKNTFRAEQGVIRVSYDEYEEFDGQFGHLFYEVPFSHYVLELEYRFTGRQLAGGPSWAYRNSGVMVHGQSPESMNQAQEFPVSIEVQLLGGNGNSNRSTGNLCTPGTNVVLLGKLFRPHCVNSSSATFHGDQWVRVEIEVRGNERITHRVNGELVLDYSQPQLDPEDAVANELMKTLPKQLRAGTISLQSESHPVEFRNIKLLSLQD